MRSSPPSGPFLSHSSTSPPASPHRCSVAQAAGTLQLQAELQQPLGDQATEEAEPRKLEHFPGQLTTPCQPWPPPASY